MQVALIGCGRWGRNILRDLKVLGCAVTVADPEVSVREWARSSGADTVSDAQLAIDRCAGVIIATPTTTHAEVINAVLDRGVPIFVEKPLTCDASSARRLAQAAPEQLFVMDKWRYHPGISELSRIAKSGELGQVCGMHLRHTGWGIPHHDVDVTWILMPHCLSILLEVFGHLPEVNSAWAERLEGTAVGLHARCGNDPWAAIEVSARSPVKRREFCLHCENGVAWLNDGWSDYIQIARGRGASGGDADAGKRIVSSELPLLRELRAFVEYLRGGPAPRSSAAEAATVVERVETMRRMAGLL